MASSAAALALSSYMSVTVRAPNVVVPGHRRDVGIPSLKSVQQRTVVRCQAKPEKGPSSAPKPISKVSTKLSDALAFSGPAPERINGRLAMLGFVAALAVEAARGDDIFVQLSNGGFPWFIGTAVLFSIASLVPLFNGDDVQSKTEGIMNESAELWNGRFAMLGLVALAFTEYFKGGPLV